MAKGKGSKWIYELLAKVLGKHPRMVIMRHFYWLFFFATVLVFLSGCKKNPGPESVAQIAVAIRDGDKAKLDKLLSEDRNIARNSLSWAGKEYAAVPYAAKMKRVDMVETLLKYGANVNAQDEQGASGLHWAAINNDLSLAKMLVEHKINVNSKTSKGSQALHIASEMNEFDIAIYLLNSEAEINTSNYEQMTPFLYAVEEGSIDLVKEFIKRGADPMAAVDQKTAVAGAVAWGRLDMLEFFLSLGISPDEGYPGNTTPLNIAAVHNNTKAIKILRKHGADVNTQNDVGVTPLMDAVNVEAADAALAAGADTGLRTSKGETALDIVRRVHPGNKQLIALLTIAKR